MDNLARYMHLGRLSETVPDLLHGLGSTENLWLGRANAVIAAGPNDADASRFAQAVTDVLHSPPGTGARSTAVGKIVDIFYKQLGEAELAAPSAAQGAFIPAGNAYDALRAVASVIAPAKASALVIDPYMDEKTLEYALLATEGVTIRLLSDQQTHKPVLRTAVNAWNSQHAVLRPLEARLAPAKSLHDRLIIVDEKTVFILTQSLNAFAARSPASIVRVEDDAAALKLGAYKAIWAAALAI